MDNTAVDTTAEEKNRRKFSRWYDRNRDDHNAKRRKAYAQDPERRKKAREASRKYREEHGASKRPINKEPSRMTADGKALYRPSQAAVMISRSVETLRTWRRNGWIPAVEGNLYSMKQIELLQQLANTVEKHRYAKGYDEMIEQVLATLHAEWDE